MNLDFWLTLEKGFVDGLQLFAVEDGQELRVVGALLLAVIFVVGFRKNLESKTLSADEDSSDRQHVDFWENDNMLTAIHCRPAKVLTRQIANPIFKL
jgi:hypothetical protein